MGKMTKNDALIALLLGVAIATLNVAVLVTGIGGAPTLEYAWPGFLVVLLFLIGKEKTVGDDLKIMASGVVGILYTFVAGLIINPIIGALGLEGGLWVGIFVGVAVYAFLMPLLPVVFNNYGFLYYLVAACFATAHTVEWLIVCVCFGAVFMLLMFGGIRLLCGFWLPELKLKLTKEEPQE